jgi:hypothetical protein
MKENFPNIMKKYQDRKKNLSSINNTHISIHKHQKSNTINYLLK